MNKPGQTHTEERHAAVKRSRQPHATATASPSGSKSHRKGGRGPSSWETRDAKTRDEGNARRPTDLWVFGREMQRTWQHLSYGESQGGVLSSGSCGGPGDAILRDADTEGGRRGHEVSLDTGREGHSVKKRHSPEDTSEGPHARQGDNAHVERRWQVQRPSGRPTLGPKTSGSLREAGQTRDDGGG